MTIGLSFVENEEQNVSDNAKYAVQCIYVIEIFHHVGGGRLMHVFKH